MTTNSSLAWEGLLDATRTLKAKADSRKPIVFPPDALRSINQVARQRLGDTVFALLDERWSDGVRALALCKKGDLSAAGAAFAHAYQRLDDLTGEARQLAEVLYCSKVAYYQYRMGQYSAAEDSVARALSIDDTLQSVYYAFHGHKLHVLQNMSRTLAFRKRFDAAADLVLNILHYMIMPCHKPLHVGNWGAVYLRQYSEIQPIDTMFEFAFFDFCRDCFRFPALETSVIQRSKAFTEALKRVANSSDVYTVALDWFQTKRSLYVRDSANAYLRRSTTFLNGYSERYDAFKLLLLWDAARVAELLNQPTEKQAITSFIHDYYELRLVG
ncbi:hypothetical protein [Spirosoma oryzicola]|uniref:hypothetical protein n=1 Tax=Spirosoma oryzicola TaxID=2898794 RepID=UPI001E3F4F9B|nr:hypothetical protein [Spirosoma oryzicola]UHG94936.1 hypothetical protein LQ777_29950 [Spirosoma oryzicola]